MTRRRILTDLILVITKVNLDCPVWDSGRQTIEANHIFLRIYKKKILRVAVFLYHLIGLNERL